MRTFEELQNSDHSFGPVFDPSFGHVFDPSFGRNVFTAQFIKELAQNWLRDARRRIGETLSADPKTSRYPIDGDELHYNKRACVDYTPELFHYIDITSSSRERSYNKLCDCDDMKGLGVAKALTRDTSLHRPFLPQ